MANDGRNNLVPQSERTKDEQRTIAQMGGIASGQARREKKTFQELAKIILDETYSDKNGNTKTGREIIILKQLEKAMKGDTKSFEVLRDTAGEKPKEQVELIGFDKTTADNIEAFYGCDIPK